MEEVLLHLFAASDTKHSKEDVGALAPSVERTLLSPLFVRKTV